MANWLCFVLPSLVGSAVGCRMVDKCLSVPQRGKNQAYNRGGSPSIFGRSSLSRISSSFSAFWRQNRSVSERWSISSSPKAVTILQWTLGHAADSPHPSSGRYKRIPIKKWLYISRHCPHCGISPNYTAAFTICLNMLPGFTAHARRLSALWSGCSHDLHLYRAAFRLVASPYQGPISRNPCSCNTSQPGNAPSMNLTREETGNFQVIGAMLHCGLGTCIAPTWANCIKILNVHVGTLLPVCTWTVYWPASEQTPSVKHDSYISSYWPSCKNGLQAVAYRTWVCSLATSVSSRRQMVHLLTSILRFRASLEKGAVLSQWFVQKSVLPTRIKLPSI